MACGCPTHISHLASCTTACVCAGPIEPKPVARKSDGGKIELPKRVNGSHDGHDGKRTPRMG